MLDTFDLDTSPIEEFGLNDPTYRAFSYLDGTGCCVANAAAFTLPLVINGKARECHGPSIRGHSTSVAVPRVEP